MFGPDGVYRDRHEKARTWHGEPRIDDLLDDPVTQLVMRRDQVSRDELTRMLDGMRETLRRV